MSFTIRTTDAPDESVRKLLIGSLLSYNETQSGRHDLRPLTIAIDDGAGKVVGGLLGRTAYDWLFVELLFVPESLRGRGVGTDLMWRAEAEALARGCHSAWLDTFYGREFYEHLGYTCFGVLDNYPAGTSRSFMRKVLTP